MKTLVGVKQEQDYYRPQRSCGQGNIFTPVFLFTGGVSASVHAGIPATQSRHPPGSRYLPKKTPPGTRHPPGQDTPQTRHTHTPWDQTSPQTRHPPEQTPP